MTSIRLDPTHSWKPEDKEKWIEKAKEYLKNHPVHSNHHSKLIDAYKYGLKWNCRHNLRPGECSDPICIAEFIHAE